MNLPTPEAELLAYCRRLEELVAARRQALPALPADTRNGEVAEAVRRLGKGDSLEEMGQVAHGDADLAGAFAAVCRLFAEYFPTDPLSQALLPALAAGEFGELFRRHAWAEVESGLRAWAAARDGDEELLLQLAHWAAAPARRRAATHYRRELAEMTTNERGRCPVCGRSADFAELSDQEHGRRYLVCLPCDLRWPFKRLGCPFCDNQDYEQLGYLLVEECKAYKIYHCDQCKGYLKTYDQREEAPRLAEGRLLENANTYFLDLLAVRQGYLPG